MTGIEQRTGEQARRSALASPLLGFFLIVGFCGFLFFYGLGNFGLVGADEPRYAQVAREMLARHDWVTPTLSGSPWLEKPPLYYWQAMIAYSVFGVSDWAARLPSAFDATLAVLGVGLFFRRFELGSFRDSSLLLASSVAFIGFARAAATDMPLAATFTLAMLAWFTWMEDGRSSFLAAFYALLGLGMLAKGPVAPFLAGVIVLGFSAVSREWRVAYRTLWIPGVLLFLAISLPWYVLVQIRNPEFFRTFILEHNLARFGTNLYHHKEPFWYYLPVTLLGAAPWTVYVVMAVGSAFRKAAHSDKPGELANRSLPRFLLIWLAVPVFFFSLSQSKLPGYILPAIPAAIVLAGCYAARKTENAGCILHPPLVLHSVLSGLLVVPALMLPTVLLQHKLQWGKAAEISFGAAALLALVVLLLLRSRWNLTNLRRVTMIPVLLGLVVTLRIGTARLDRNLSARPVVTELRRLAPSAMPIALYRVSRETEYGLVFYTNQNVSRYENGQIPSSQHILMTKSGAQPELSAMTQSRQLLHLGRFADQNLEFYWVSAQQP